MLLESIEEDQETQQKHIYELYLQSFNKNDSSFCMEGERLLVSFGLHPQVMCQCVFKIERHKGYFGFKEKKPRN